LCHLSVCLSVYLSVHLSVCPSVFCSSRDSHPSRAENPLRTAVVSCAPLGFQGSCFSHNTAAPPPRKYGGALRLSLATPVTAFTLHMFVQAVPTSPSLPLPRRPGATAVGAVHAVHRPLHPLVLLRGHLGVSQAVPDGTRWGMRCGWLVAEINRVQLFPFGVQMWHAVRSWQPHTGPAVQCFTHLFQFTGRLCPVRNAK
jgi:hypothetical protein